MSSKILAWSLASFHAAWAVTDWDQTSESREGDPIVLDNRFFVCVRGPTSGGGDKLDSPVTPFSPCFPLVGAEKETSLVSTHSLMMQSTLFREKHGDIVITKPKSVTFVLLTPFPFYHSCHCTFINFNLKMLVVINWWGLCCIMSLQLMMLEHSNTFSQ